MKYNKYWFKSKRFGWGFVPITWEGWVATLLLLGIVQVAAFFNNIFSPEVSVKDTLSFVFDTSLIILISIPFFKKKCKDKPRWRWGK